MTLSRAPGGEASGAAARTRRANSRLIGRAVFAALIVATIGAFFISQHLKVTTPFISGVSGPTPPAINPINGPTACRDPANGRKVSERSTTVSFYVVHRADNVNVYVVDQSGATVRTIARGVPMHKSKAPTPHAFRAVTKYFNWNGKNNAGRLVAPGSYFFEVFLVHQQRTIELQQPVAVETAARCEWKG
jgi:hypothetical protein